MSVFGPNFTIPDLQAVYSRPYDAAMLKWRELGAVDKAANLLQMTRAVNGEISSVLEVGCGTGAVLRRVAAGGCGAKHAGIEITDERVETAKQGISQEIDLRSYDGKTIPFEDGAFDLVYATHVLEHVTNPRGFLHELRRVSRRFVFIEVPCEMTFRATHRVLQPSLNIGHINLYTPISLALTLETSGLVVKDLKVLDSSFAVHAFRANRAVAFAKVAVRRMLLCLSKELASSIFTYHCAALCAKGELLTIA